MESSGTLGGGGGTHLQSFKQLLLPSFSPCQHSFQNRTSTYFETTLAPCDSALSFALLTHFSKQHVQGHGLGSHHPPTHIHNSALISKLAFLTMKLTHKSATLFLSQPNLHYSTGRVARGIVGDDGIIMMQNCKPPVFHHLLLLPYLHLH